MLRDIAAFVVAGVGSGAVYALIGLAVTLVYGLTRIINFAVGPLIAVGGLVAWSLRDQVTSPLVALLGTALVLAFVGGFVADRLLFRFTLRDPLSGFVVSLGLILFLENASVEIWGTNPRSHKPPLTGTIDMLGVTVQTQLLFNVGITSMCLAVLYLVILRTKFGKALRASSDDREAALLVGIPVSRVIGGTFVIAAALIGVAGWIVLSQGTISPYSGDAYLLRGFAVALVGGLGRIEGAVVAGFGLGIAEALAAGYGEPSWTNVYVFAIIVVILLIRPTGLFGGTSGAHL